MTYCATCNAVIWDEDERTCRHCDAPRPAAGWPLDRRLGATVAGHQYRVLRRLGTGGFGTVYEVETMVGGLRRALKILHAERAGDSRARERFINEAVVLEQLAHPNVARCYAAGALEGGHELYLLLELVDGIPLARLVSDAAGQATPLAPLRAIRIAKQIASGLVAVHANHVLHRDLTPRNVLITGANTADERVKLVDFGIAGTLEAETMSAQTLLGTPRFMAPEQLTPSGELDVRSDLWQLGALLHYMMTGEAPGSDPSEEQANGGLLGSLLRRLLARDPHDRPRSAAEVCEELARAEHELLPGARTDDSLSLLAALCSQPGEDGWWAVCRYLLARENVEHLVAAAHALLEAWPDALRRAPLPWWQAARRGGSHRLWSLVRSLDLSGQGLEDDDVSALAGDPALATLTVLSLAHNHIGNAGVAALARSPYLSALRDLDLTGNRISSEGVDALPGTLQRLDTLRLGKNGIGPRGAEAIARADWRLQALDLSHNDIRAPGAAALTSSPHLGELRRLSLAGNGIGSDGASAIAVSRTLTRLKTLDLSANGIGHGGAAALALSTNGGSIGWLSLAQNNLGLEGVELLLSSHRYGGLETLDLSSNDIGPQGAMALASSPFVRRLKRLHLDDNRLGDAGLAALLGAPFLTGLRTLSIAQNNITAGGIVLLGGAPPELEVLDLSRNPLRAEGLDAVCAVLPRLRLHGLAMSDCELPGNAMPSLLHAAPRTLADLSVAGNAFGAEWRMSSHAQVAARLTCLDLSRNALGPAAFAAMLERPELRSLVALRANSNALGDGDAVRLTDVLSQLPALEVLQLRDNALDPSIIRAIVRSPFGARVKTLDLGLNQLGDAGATVLAEPPGLPALRVLDLEQNGIAFAAAASILAAPGMPLLQAAGFARNALKSVVDLHSLARRKIELLETTFARVAADGADLSERFYSRLFERYPAVKPLFAHAHMRRQQQHLIAALTMVIEHLRGPDLVLPALAAMAERHVGYGVYPSHYQAFVATMLDTLRDIVGGEWTADVEDAWHDGLEAIASAMMRAQQEAASRDRGLVMQAAGSGHAP